MKAIRRILANQPPHWVGDGFPVRSLFSYSGGNQFDPFLLLDYASPYEFGPAAAPRGVGKHPHRGFETVTIVYQGELEHADSAGNHGMIGPGDVQWMTAASGVIHEEFHSERLTREGGMFEVAQLWLNLPASVKMSPPKYQEILSRQIPAVELPDAAGTLRVIAGKFGDAIGPAKSFTPVNLWDLRITHGKRAMLQVQPGDTTLLVVQHGRANINGNRQAESVALIQFDPEGSEIELHAEDDAHVLLLSGTPINEPVYGQGPFVMNTREEIQQAFLDFRNM
jgi:quercetin 2,3-dioxygenase